MEQNGTPAGGEELILALAETDTNGGTIGAGVTTDSDDASPQTDSVSGGSTFDDRDAAREARNVVTKAPKSAEIKAERAHGAHEHGGKRTKRNKSEQVRRRCLRALSKSGTGRHDTAGGREWKIGRRPS